MDKEKETVTAGTSDGKKVDSEKALIILKSLDRELVLNLINRNFSFIASHLTDMWLLDKEELIKILLDTAKDCKTIAEQLKKLK